jgi:DHA1 family tetracycline resistance protein-like MFS transporter
MQFIFSPILGALSDRFGRRPVVLLSNFGLALDYVLMALAPSLTLAVHRPGDLGHHLGEHLHGLCLYRRRDAAGTARRGVRQDRRGVRRRIHPGPAVGGLLGDMDPRLPFWIAAGLSFRNALTAG